MNPGDIAEVTAALAKGGPASVAAVALSVAGKRILGPAVDEFGEMWRDKVRFYRFKRQLECVKKAERFAQEAGFTPEAVPIKLLFPLLEGASLEGDEDLHTMWSALLANAALPHQTNEVRPGYIAILRQLAPDEAAVLNWMLRNSLSKAERLPKRIMSERASGYACGLVDLAEAWKKTIDRWGRPTPEFEECLASLEAGRLIERLYLSVDDKTITQLRLTPHGAAFLKACTPPSANKPTRESSDN